MDSENDKSTQEDGWQLVERAKRRWDGLLIFFGVSVLVSLANFLAITYCVVAVENESLYRIGEVLACPAGFFKNEIDNFLPQLIADTFWYINSLLWGITAGFLATLLYLWDKRSLP